MSQFSSVEKTFKEFFCMAMLAVAGVTALGCCLLFWLFS